MIRFPWAVLVVFWGAVSTICGFYLYWVVQVVAMWLVVLEVMVASSYGSFMAWGLAGVVVGVFVVLIDVLLSLS